MAKDLLDDRYGRFRELSLALATFGHDVRGVCLSYSSRPEETVIDQRGPFGVRWDSVNLGANWPVGLARHRRLLRRVASEMQPDVVLAFSDAYQVTQGVRFAREFGIPSCVDLYDNFESYRGMKIPLAKSVFRRAVQRADVVSCISRPLANMVEQTYGRNGPTAVLNNAIPESMFNPGDRRAARHRLGLPIEACIVGLAGSLTSDRDVETVFRAVDLVSGDIEDLALVVAGPREEGLSWPSSAPVIDLGIVEHGTVPDVIRAADVMIVPNRDSDFGRFCYPQKAVETIATGVPMVAADTPVMRELLNEIPDSLYEIGRPADLARAIQLRLADRRVTPWQVATWAEIGRQLEYLILAAIDRSDPQPRSS